MIGLIGAGPLGLELAVALKRLQMPYLHFEAGQVGATMAWWAPGTRWFSSSERISIAGVPLETPNQEKATREEYLAYLRSIVQQFSLSIHTFTEVLAVRSTGASTVLHEPSARRSSGIQGPISSPSFDLHVRSALHPSASEEVSRVDQVIFATGGTAFPNLLNIPGESLPHVSHYFQDPHKYFSKRLLIVGGRNSAVEAALRCYRAGAKVSVCYRGSAIDAKDIKYWLYPEFSGLVKAGKIEGKFNTTVEEIMPGEVRLRNAEGMKIYPFDFVLLLTGYWADMSLMRSAGVAVVGEQEVPAYDPETMETNVPGVYVAGTAVAGTQRRYRVFLENCHVHVERIVAHLQGKVPPSAKVEGEVLERPES